MTYNYRFRFNWNRITNLQEKAWYRVTRWDCTFLTSGFHKIQDGGQKRRAVCEFATNSSVEERKEKHNRWYDLKTDIRIFISITKCGLGTNLAKSDVVKSDVVVFEIVVFTQ